MLNDKTIKTQIRRLRFEARLYRPWYSIQKAAVVQPLVYLSAPSDGHSGETGYLLSATDNLERTTAKRTNIAKYPSVAFRSSFHK